MKTTVVITACPCGNEIATTQQRILVGRGKFCSQKCKYKYRVRPVGLNYSITKENSAWYKKGERPSITTEFKKGQTPPNFLGDSVGYFGLHDWIYERLGKPNKCEHCGKESEGRYEWANKSHTYKRDIEDWIRLCKSCHVKYDRKNNDEAWGLATRKFNFKKRTKK